MTDKLLETYVSLHNHTDYSNLKFPDSTNRIGTLIDRAHELGLLGVAITDHDTVSSYIKAENHLSKRRKENPEDETWQNFKLILGNEIYLCRNGLNKDNYEAGKDSYFHFILLAKDKVGNDQIRELSYRAWTRSYFYFHNRVPTYWEDLEDIIQKNQGHVMGSTACLGGQLPRLIVSREEASNDSVKKVYSEAIELVVNKWISIFGEGNFYFELQPGVTEEQILVNKRLYELSQEMNVPCIITTDTHYLTVEDRPVHKAFLTSKAGDRETDAFYEATYMMTADEIRERIDYLSVEDINQMFQNTIDIGNACEEYTLKRSLEIPYMPKDEYDEELRYELNIDKTKYPYFYKFYNSSKPNQQMIIRLFNFINEDDYSKEHFEESLTTAEIELKIIWDSSEKMGVDWSKYFLQVTDIIKVVWTLGDSITAPSRGSAGASFVLYALGVIQINPMREKAPLIFERFLNPDRASVLDIDTDVESSKRQRSISALQEVYGEERVVRVATFRTETTRQVIKTAGRGLGMEQDTYDFIASLIGSNRGIDYSLSEMYYGSEEKQLKPNPTFVQQMNKYPDLWTTASTLEGIINGVGVHAGGIILDERPIYETAGVMRTNKGEIVTSFELNDCEEVSLIKVDLLSTKALSKIRTCIDLLCDYGYAETGNSLKETYENIIGIYNLDRTSPEMWKMTHEGQITSLFQMEKQSGVQGIRLTKPESVEDLATLNSVIRLQAPERGMEQPLDKYARFREHPEQWEVEMDRYGLSEDEKTLMHKMLDHSSGISAQQEDLYQIILEPKIAGFSFGEADKLRKIVASFWPPSRVTS